MVIKAPLILTEIVTVLSIYAALIISLKLVKDSLSTYSPKQVPNIGIILVCLFLQVRKLVLKKVKSFSQGHPATK